MASLVGSGSHARVSALDFGQQLVKVAVIEGFLEDVFVSSRFVTVAAEKHQMLFASEANLTGRFGAVECGHLDIDDYDVRRMITVCLHELVSIRRGGHDLVSLDVRYCLRDHLSHELGVVRHEYSSHITSYRLIIFKIVFGKG